MFFVDEIHRLPRAVEETFYPAMEDGQLPITVGAGAGARVVTLDLPPFTLIGATTRAGLLTTPLRDRFGIQHRLDHYDAGRPGARSSRARRACSTSQIDADGARAIAERARGTPRVANRLLKRVRDYAQVHGDGAIDAAAADAALDLLEVDHEGLDRLDREILTRRSASASAAARSGCRRSRSRCTRSRTRSRTSTSRTCCSAASSSARRAGAARPPHAFRHLGLEPPRRRRRACSV